MPAKHLLRENKPETYYHIYNRGVEKRTIFSDSNDFETFEEFLKEYLTPPADPESVKKVFTVNGKSYRGTPHQPKNYHDTIELLGYGLMPNHFHMVLRQKTQGSVESFIRSLCTRYSMYFNKKYQRTGSLFEGPYKSVQISEAQLPSLIQYIHHGTNDYSSYSEYSGKRNTSWVNTNTALPGGKMDKEKGAKLLIGITLEEDGTQHLEGRDLDVSSKVSTVPASRVPEVSALFATFLILLGLGVRNINVSQANNIALSPTLAPAVLSESAEPTSPPKSNTIVIVEIPDDQSFINIRQGPDIASPKVGEAKNGDTFEFVSVNSGFYEIKLTDGQTGYISAEYTYLQD